MTSQRSKSRRPPWAMAAVVRIWMCRFRLLLLLLFGVWNTSFSTTTTRFSSAILPITHAFELGQPSCSFRRLQYYSDDYYGPTTTATRVSLAIIYDPDGNRVNDDDEYLYLDSKNEETTAVVLQDEFQHRLQNDDRIPQVLIRIACAHAPPPHDTILPSQVVSWNLVSLQPSSTPPSYTHIYDTAITTTKTILQVALGLPQEEDESMTRDRGSTTVAQILVGIPLSTSCDITTTSEEVPTATTMTVTAIPTIIDALIVELEERLDPIARRILQAREEEQQQNAAAPPSEWQLLPDDNNDDEEYDLPEWWTINGALTDECTLLRSILNEDDFIKDLLRVAASSTFPTNTSSSTSWGQAKVVLVGPSGILLRAVRNSSSSTTTTTTTIPIQFETIATTSEMLRSLVLDLVEGPQDAQAPEQPQDAAEKSPSPPPIEVTMDETTMTTTTDTSPPSFQSTTTQTAVEDAVLRRRRQEQPKSPDEEAQLAAKYAAITNLGDRAYAILKDLGMI